MFVRRNANKACLRERANEKKKREGEAVKSRSVREKEKERDMEGIGNRSKCRRWLLLSKGKKKMVLLVNAHSIARSDSSERQDCNFLFRIPRFCYTSWRLSNCAPSSNTSAHYSHASPPSYTSRILIFGQYYTVSA